MKKGQATPFIIVGIILVILVVVVIFLTKPAAIGGTLSMTQVQPIRKFIEEDCIKTRLNDVLIDLRRNGGFLLLDKNKNVNFEDSDVYLKIDEKNYIRYICCAQGVGPNVNIEDDISKDIKNYLFNKCKLDDFEDDFDIVLPKKEDIEVNTNLGEKKVLVDIKFPVVIKRGMRSIELKDFSISVDDDIGKINEIVKEIYTKKQNGEDLQTKIKPAIDGYTFLGNCDDLSHKLGCYLYIAGDYLHVWTRYDIDNNIGKFMFAIKK